MLVLTRKQGEGIVIGDDVRVFVVEMRNGHIRLGIEAPKDRKIYRMEVYDRISRENQEAAQWNMDDLQQLAATLTKESR